MKFYVFIILFGLVSCNYKMKRETDVVPEIKSKTIVIQQSKKENTKELIFADKTKLILKKEQTNKDIDSIHKTGKYLNAKYLHCGKFHLSENILDAFRKNNQVDFKKIIDSKTAHAIEQKGTKFYIFGYDKISCLNEGDSVRVEVDVYQLFHNNELDRLAIISSINKYQSKSNVTLKNQ